MGVKDLWTILEPVKQFQSLSDLRGQVIAVDLSIWIVEAQTLQLKGVVKPHLRNLFFRVSSLLQLDIVPVIVVEGTPPDLKQHVMKERAAVHYQGVPCTSVYNLGKMTRKRFTAVHRECCEMLDCLGVPYVQSAGEAEAMCAFLDKHNMVDGCITNDGDAFLYGATTVYRNFTVNGKEPHFERYSSNDIKTKLSLDQERLVALAVLLGCDYLPKGVPGVGPELAMRFISSLDTQLSVLQRFDAWVRMADGAVDSKSAEWQVCKKSLRSPGFPHRDVTAEFLIDKDKLPTKVLRWKRPEIFHMMKYAHLKMEWPEKYGLEKVLPLVTLYDLKSLAVQPSSQAVSGCMKPYRIAKSRIRQGIACFEVEWHKIDGDNITETEYYITVEEQGLFEKAFPNIVFLFHQAIKEKKDKRVKKTSGRNRKKDTKDTDIRCDYLNRSLSMSDMDGPPPNGITLSSVDIHKSTVQNQPRGLRRSLSLGVLCDVVPSYRLTAVHEGTKLARLNGNLQCHGSDVAVKQSGRLDSMFGHITLHDDDDEEEEEDDGDSEILPLRDRLKIGRVHETDTMSFHFDTKPHPDICDFQRSMSNHQLRNGHAQETDIGFSSDCYGSKTQSDVCDFQRSLSNLEVKNNHVQDSDTDICLLSDSLDGKMPSGICDFQRPLSNFQLKNDRVQDTDTDIGLLSDCLDGKTQSDVCDHRLKISHVQDADNTTNLQSSHLDMKPCPRTCDLQRSVSNHLVMRKVCSDSEVVTKMKRHGRRREVSKRIANILSDSVFENSPKVSSAVDGDSVGWNVAVASLCSSNTSTSSDEHRDAHDLFGQLHVETAGDCSVQECEEYRDIGSLVSTPVCRSVCNHAEDLLQWSSKHVGNFALETSIVDVDEAEDENQQEQVSEDEHLESSSERRHTDSCCRLPHRSASDINSLLAGEVSQNGHRELESSWCPSPEMTMLPLAERLKQQEIIVAETRQHDDSVVEQCFVGMSKLAIEEQHHDLFEHYVSHDSLFSNTNDLSVIVID